MGRRGVQRAKVAVSVIFAVNGLALRVLGGAGAGSIRDTLGLTPGRVGLLLLAARPARWPPCRWSGLVVGRLGVCLARWPPAWSPPRPGCW